MFYVININNSIYMYVLNTTVGAIRKSTMNIVTFRSISIYSFKKRLGRCVIT